MDQRETAWTSAWDAGQKARERNLRGATWFHHVSLLSEDQAHSEAARLNLPTANKTHRQLQTDLLATEGWARVSPPSSWRGAWLLDNFSLFYWKVPG